jgi:hypothetical protein
MTNACFRAKFCKSYFPFMAGQNEPKEAVRIDLPRPTAARSSDQSVRPRETMRIQLPIRNSSGKAPLHTSREPQPAGGSAAQDVSAAHFFRPSNPPPISTPLSASVMLATDSLSSGLRKETVRVPLVPDPLPPAAQIKKTQPPSAMRDVAPRNPSTAVEPSQKNSMPLMWMLLGVSVLILIIQIWTYFS